MKPLPADATDFVKLYFTDQVIDLLVTETNHYAEQYIASSVIPAPFNRWRPSGSNGSQRDVHISWPYRTYGDRDVYKPRLAMNWSSDELGYTKTAFFGKTMPRDRFLPARRYASAGLCDSDVSVRPSVRPSVCLSVCHTPVLCLAERNQDREMYTI